MSDPYSPYPENPGGYGSSTGNSGPYPGQPLPPTEYGAYPQQQQPYYPPQQPYPSNDYNPYAAPVYQPYAAPAQPGQTNIPGIISLVLGIASIVLSWVFFLGLPGSIAGIILGIIGMRRTAGKGLAVGGLVCSIIGLVLSACIGVLLIIGISNSSQY